MGSKSKELGVRHTNRERPLVGTYAACTFALCPWSPEFVVRSSHLAFGSWQSVARGILKFSSTQAFCSRIVMSTDKFAHMCVAIEVACESVLAHQQTIDTYGNLFFGHVQIASWSSQCCCCCRLLLLLLLLSSAAVQAATPMCSEPLVMVARRQRALSTVHAAQHTR